MTRPALLSTFHAGFYLTELQYLLQHSLCIPLEGYPPRIYLSLRQRIRKTIDTLPVTPATKPLGSAAQNAINLIQSKPCYDADVGQPCSFPDISAAMRASHANRLKLRLIRARNIVLTDINNQRALAKAMDRSHRAASALDLAMGEFRERLQPEACLFFYRWLVVCNAVCLRHSAKPLVANKKNGWLSNRHYIVDLSNLLSSGIVDS